MVNCLLRKRGKEELGKEEMLSAAEMEMDWNQICCA